MTVVPTQEDLAKLDNYTLQELPGGFYVGAPPCLSSAIMCNASLTDEAVQEVEQKCSPPQYDVDGDGKGELVIAIDWSTNRLEALKNENGTWTAKCYQLVPKSSPLQINDLINQVAQAISQALNVPAEAIQGFLNALWQPIQQILNTLGTLGIVIIIVILLIIIKEVLG